MTGPRITRNRAIALYLISVLLIGVGVWRVGYVQGLDTLSRQGQADLALASDRVAGQLQRYRELAVLLSDHPAIAPLSIGAETQIVDSLFEEVADKTAALDIFFVDTAGHVRAAARPGPDWDLGETDYVARAMQGALGSGMGSAWPLDQRAYYFAAPHFGAQGQVRGAVVVAADIGEIEWDWAGSNPAVFFTDAAGQVRITNRSELVDWQRRADPPGFRRPDGGQPPFNARFVSGHDIWRIGWGRYLPARALHIMQDMPVFALRAEALLDLAPVQRLAVLQALAFAGIGLAFGAILFLVSERRRALALANTLLENRVAERTQALEASNAALRREVIERQEAEAALRRAQENLIQAGKLSALGQMSAGISHELNQPLMAIRSFADNGSTFMERGNTDAAHSNLSRISALAERMGRIIRNLRAFSRQETTALARVDLVAAIDSALELTDAALRQGGVQLRYVRPDQPIWVQGGEVRLSQVFVNLISNAIDAMSLSDTRTITVTIRTDARLSVRVADTGPGLDLPDKVFEPFYSTKADPGSDGMGLGLSISYGIVQSFGGVIRGENADAGGAVFTVELEPWSEAQVA